MYTGAPGGQGLLHRFIQLISFSPNGKFAAVWDIFHAPALKPLFDRVNRDTLVKYLHVFLIGILDSKGLFCSFFSLSVEATESARCKFCFTCIMTFNAHKVKV